jgi:hypothetical protein
VRGFDEILFQAAADLQQGGGIIGDADHVLSMNAGWLRV